jgi:hypothetical protein
MMRLKSATEHFSRALRILSRATKQRATKQSNKAEQQSRATKQSNKAMTEAGA